MRWLTILCLIILTAAATPQRPADGYLFKQGTPRQPTLTIKVVMVKDNQALAASQQANLPPGIVMKGYARWTDKKCTVFIIDPAVSYQPEYIGHELTHCLYGNFHPDQHQSMR